MRLPALAALAGSCTSAPAQTPDIPRTAEGAPDFQGVWESRWPTPLERMDGTTEPTVSGNAAAAYVAARNQSLHGEGVALRPDDDFDFAGLLPAGDGAYRTSLIVEPDTGKRRQTQLARDPGPTLRNTRKAAENPEALWNDERCLSANGRAPPGTSPGSMYRQIVQAAGYMMISTEDQIVTRVIGIGAAPRPADLPSTAGDSIANWDGDTLIVITDQIRSQLAPPGAPPFDQERRLTKRFSLIAPDKISYDCVLEDSAMLSAPMRVQYTLVRTNPTLLGPARHEGNYSILHMMLGARLMETTETSKPKP